jgi:hypothetical protein
MTEENKKYDWTQVYTFDYDPKMKLKSTYNAQVQHMDDYTTLEPEMFLIEDNQIDIDMLQVSGDEANRLYNELKARAIRVHKQRVRERKIREIVNQDDFEQDHDFDAKRDNGNRGTFSGDEDFKKQQVNKILEILTKSNT